MDKSA
jgi:hypothetical protein